MMKDYLITIGIVAIVLMFVLPKAIDIFTKIMKKDSAENKTTCIVCGKSIKGKPARCPHCGEQLRWKDA